MLSVRRERAGSFRPSIQSLAARLPPAVRASCPAHLISMKMVLLAWLCGCGSFYVLYYCCSVLVSAIDIAYYANCHQPPEILPHQQPVCCQSKQQIIVINVAAETGNQKQQDIHVKQRFQRETACPFRTKNCKIMRPCAKLMLMSHFLA